MIWLRLRARASTLSLPVARKNQGIKYEVPPGCDCSRNHSRCWANVVGNAYVLPTAAAAAGPLPLAFTFMNTHRYSNISQGKDGQIRTYPILSTTSRDRASKIYRAGPSDVPYIK